jgi:hypothetical protein
MRPPLLLAAAAFALAVGATAARADAPEEWRFDVLLDGSPIGSQTFRRDRDGETSRVTIDASFDVKFLFLTAYSYRHHHEEVWRGNCLASMESKTDDNGKLFRVSASATPEGFVVDNGGGAKTLPACVDSFAYWDPAELRASHLLNSQTGEYEAVRLEEHGEETLPFRGRDVPARRVALVGDKLHIDLWYTNSDEWLALESTTTSGRRLKYVRQ